MKQKIKIFLCIVFFAVIVWPNIISKNNFPEYRSEHSEHYRYLQEWRERLEQEKEEEKKEETWSNTFHIGSKQVLDQTTKIFASILIAGLTFTFCPLSEKKRETIAGAALFISIVTLNWKFHSPIQRRIIRKEARKMMIKEISSQIEKANNQCK